ncbi:MAG: hypothetical protein ACTS8Z_01320, partial [Candidatus Limnocylindrales bacterium]
MLLSAAAVYGVANSTVFEYRNVDLEGATFTDPDAVVAALEGARGQNLFQLVGAPLEAEIRTLPTVRSEFLSVDQAGPFLTVRERASIAALKTGHRCFDRGGTGSVSAVSTL